MNDQDNKSVGKNAIFNVLYRVVNMIFPLVTAIYVSHVLLASGVGKVNTAQNVANYFALLAPLGILNYGTREVAKRRKSKESSEKLFSELFIINFCSTLLCVFLYYSMIFCFAHFKNERLLYVVAGLPIIINFINVEWYYQGFEDYVYIAVRGIIVKTISVIAILCYVKTANDYIIYSLIYSLGVAGNHIFNIINLLIRGVRFNIHGISIIPHLKSILILLSSNIAIEIYTLLDITMLGILCRDEVVGFYSNSIKLVKIIVSLISAIGGVLLPRLSFYFAIENRDSCNALVNKVTKVMMFLAIPCSVGIFLLADNLVRVMFGESFLPAISTVRIASALILVIGFSNLYGTQVLITFSQEKKLLLCTCTGAFINVVLNYFLIPLYQQNGAIIASVITETAVTFFTIIFAKKYIIINVPFDYVVKNVVAVTVMGAFVVFVKRIIQDSLLGVIISIFLGSTIYGFVGFILKNSIIIEFIITMKNRFKKPI